MGLGIRIRSTGVITGVWAATLGTLHVLRPTTAPPPQFDAVLVWLASWAVLGGVGWLALTATLLAARAWLRPPAGRGVGSPVGCPAGWRRAVLVLCGLAVVAGTATPALAASRTPVTPPGVVGAGAAPVEHVAPRVPHHPLATLPMPSRPTGALRSTLTPAAQVPARHTVVVRRGDSLWLLARRQLPVESDDAAVARYVGALYDHNRSVIGADPDLIEPGTRLVLSAGTHT